MGQQVINPFHKDDKFSHAASLKIHGAMIFPLNSHKYLILVAAVEHLMVLWKI